MSAAYAPTAGAPSEIARREATAADMPSGCADGRRSRGRLDCRLDCDLEIPRPERAVRDGDATLRRMRAKPVGKWRASLCRRRRRDVPWANSAAERAMGDSQSGLWDGTSDMDSSVIAVVSEILSNPRHRSGYAALRAC